MTIGSTKRQTFRFGENFPLELSRNILSSFVLWHRKNARKKRPFVPGIAPDTLRFARYIILKIRPRVSARTTWSVNTKIEIISPQYVSHFFTRFINNAIIRILMKSAVRQSLRHFDVKKKRWFIRREFFFSLSAAVNSRLLSRRYACSSVPRQAKKRNDRQKAVLRSISYYQTHRVRFPYEKFWHARARGKISGRANKNERDVRTDKRAEWIFNLISQTSEMKNASTRQQKNCSARYWKFANQAKRQFAPEQNCVA